MPRKWKWGQYSCVCVCSCYSFPFIFGMCQLFSSNVALIFFYAVEIFLLKGKIVCGCIFFVKNLKIIQKMKKNFKLKRKYEENIPKNCVILIIIWPNKKEKREKTKELLSILSMYKSVDTFKKKRRKMHMHAPCLLVSFFVWCLYKTDSCR